jgi:hypothetical protein
LLALFLVAKKLGRVQGIASNISAHLEPSQTALIKMLDETHNSAPSATLCNRLHLMMFSLFLGNMRDDFSHENLSNCEIL